MGKVSLAEVKAARERIGGVVRSTPTFRSEYLSQKTGQNIHLKLENLNLSGSFKIRGAANALLQCSPTDLSRGVICASAGNHAQGMGHICRRLKTTLDVFMPERTPLVKAERTRSLGGKVHLDGLTYEDAVSNAMQFQNESRGLFVHGFADPAVICGQGTIGLELLEQVDRLSMVIVPIGGGGLIAGIACAVKEAQPDVVIIGVESEGYNSMVRSLQAGHLVTTEPAPTIADGIALRTVADSTLELTRRYVDDIVEVSENAMASAVMKLVERNHLLAEGAGAASVAGLLSIPAATLNKVQGDIVCLISGGNIDVNLLNRINNKGLIYTGRMMRLRIMILDKPGSLAALLDAAAAAGANVVEVSHNRWFSSSEYHEVEVQLDIETINEDHQRDVTKSLDKVCLSMEVLAGAVKKV